MRRDFLAFTAGAVAAKTVLPAVAQADELRIADGTKSPIQNLAAKYHEIMAASDIVERRYDTARAHLIARWGDLLPRESAWERWGHDPLYMRMSEAGGESNRLTDLATELTDEVLAIPGATAADAQAKLSVVLAVWRQMRWSDGHQEYHEAIALEFMDDLERLLGAELEVTT